MKLTVLLLTAVCLNVAAKGVAQDVTFSGKNISLEEIFSVIERQTGYLFLYQEKTLADAKPVTVEAKKEPLLKFLEAIFNNQPLQYSISSKTINVSPAPVADSSVDHRPKWQGTVDLFYDSPIRGRVLDDDGQPLSGASVSLKNSKTATVTDSEGRFTLNVNEGDIIIVSFVGYQSKNLKATPSMFGGENSLIIILSKISTELDETVVIAYGTRTKRLNTGNVTKVKADDIKGVTVSNPLLALQGRVPGLEIIPSNGLPGAGIKIRIQGENSLQNGNDPLIIIDNVPYPSQYPTTENQYLISDILGSNGGVNNFLQKGSPLSYLNTSDIESIEVLKGADATSIYGSRAANGAILITTKKGRKGRMKTDVNLEIGFQQLGKKPSLMNAQQYLEMRQETYKNDGLVPGNSDYDLNGVWDKNRSQDWFKELVGKTAVQTLAALTTSGGNENMNYSFSGNYSKQNYVFPDIFHSKNDSRGSLHTSFSSSTPNKKFSQNFILNYMYDENKLPTVDLMGIALSLSPVAPQLVTPEGHVNWEFYQGNPTFNNPIANALKTYNVRTNNLLGNLNLAYEIFPGLKVMSDFGYNKLEVNESGNTPLDAIPPILIRIGFTNQLMIAAKSTTTWNIDPRITYVKNLKAGKIDALVGTTITNSASMVNGISGYGFSSELLLNDLASASQLGGVYSDYFVYRYNAFFGRLNYNYNDKYLVQLTARQDGSSRFGNKSQFHTFTSIAGAWIFSEESFIKRNLHWLSFGKLRSSFGTTGNDQIGDYLFLTLYGAVPTPRPYQGVVGMYPNRLTNSYLQWEEVKKLEFGIDIGMFESRILLNVNYARNRSSNQLLSLGLPSDVGFQNVLINLPAKVQNKQWDFMFNTVNIKTANFNWNTSFNITLPDKKIISWPGLSELPYSFSYTVGKSPTNTKLYKGAGVNEQTGLYQFVDRNGNIVSADKLDFFSDRYFELNRDSKWFGGFTSNFSYKNLTLVFNFSGSRAYTTLGITAPGLFNVNVPTYLLDRWQKPGDKATYQKYTNNAEGSLSAASYLISSDKGYLNQYYIACNNIILSYELPKALKSIIKSQNCSVSAKAFNPFVITNNKLFDPRTSKALPPLQSVHFAINATF